MAHAVLPPRIAVVGASTIRRVATYLTARALSNYLTLITGWPHRSLLRELRPPNREGARCMESRCRFVGGA